MAILKHIASKNADYGEAQRYLMFQYNEFTNKPITGKNLGTHYDKDYLLQLLEENKKHLSQKLLNMKPCLIATFQIKLAYYPQTRRRYLSHLSLLKQTSALLLIYSNALKHNRISLMPDG